MRPVIIPTLVAFLVMIFVPAALKADNHGPHAGYVQRSGSLTTELVERGSGKYELYLLDQDWASQPFEALEVKVVLKGKLGPSPLTCTLDGYMLSCLLPDKHKLLEGEAIIAEIQNKKQATKTEVVYVYPFRHASSGQF